MDSDYKISMLKLENDLKEAQRKYERKDKRLNKIIKQSDTQQLSLINLNEQINEQKDTLNKLYLYDKQQQLAAKEKIEATITDDLENSQELQAKIINHPADILSGDLYSIHTLKNNTTLAYVIDGQGHGISPALTVFAVSSALSFLIEEDLDFQTIINRLFSMIKKLLGEVEQLSYTFISIDENKKNIHYVSGGMYPFLLRRDDEVFKYKANNLPFMNFSPMPKITSLPTQNWDSLLIYSDGLVEDLQEDMDGFTPNDFLDNSKKFEAFEKKIENRKFEDDITIVKIIKNESNEA